jgi:C-terminal processing protease CtpA/Prc
MATSTKVVIEVANSVKEFERSITTNRKEQIGSLQTVKDFLSDVKDTLTLEQRKLVVDQALDLLEKSYVHLPLKKAMHAVDPIQKLKLLQVKLQQTVEGKMEPEADFHKEILDIFIQLRDLHTNYLLPQPFASHFAFLPFLIESYGQNDNRQFIVTRIAKGYENILPLPFRPGISITYWNGIPIQRAVEMNANRNAGSNLAARFARGLQSLTYRPMRTSLPPDEEWVVIGYKTEDGEDKELKQEWLVSSQPVSFPFSFGEDMVNLEKSSKLGLDLNTELVGQMKKVLFAPENVLETEKHLASSASILEAIEEVSGLESVMPGVFEARKISQDVGYIKIRTFSVQDDKPFVEEFIRLIKLLPKNGLIIDVRGNGGGLITAAERLLQVLTPEKINPETFQFVSSPLTLEMSGHTSWLKSWHPLLLEAVTTGAPFSRGIQITTTDEANDLGQQYLGPVVLITDALCYSATDLFAAGFQDHKIGPILGVDGNTGAGGANVWTHDLLKDILKGSTYELKDLPLGIGMRVSIRRNMRVGERTGVPVEDLGITPDIKYNMTKADLLQQNIDLIKKASETLATLPTK